MHNVSLLVKHHVYDNHISLSPYVTVVITCHGSENRINCSVRNKFPFFFLNIDLAPAQYFVAWLSTTAGKMPYQPNLLMNYVLVCLVRCYQRSLFLCFNNYNENGINASFFII